MEVSNPLEKSNTNTRLQFLLGFLLDTKNPILASLIDVAGEKAQLISLLIHHKI